MRFSFPLGGNGVCSRGLGFAVLAAILICSPAFAEFRYVAPTGSAVPPYTNWTDAATDIQSAVDVAEAGDIVLVSNGTYETGTRVTPEGTLSNRVVITSNIVLRSVNGPAFTTIRGRGPVGSNAVRCLFMSQGMVEGFTLTQGHTLTTGDAILDVSGGGAMAFGGTLNDCVLTGNAGLFAGGVEFGLLNDCVIEGNTSTLDSAGAEFCSLNNCVIRDNVAGTDGGGALFCTLNHCTVTENSAARGGGVVGGAMVNCIVYFNSAASSPNHTNADFQFSCTLPLPAAGAGNVSGNPRFVDGQDVHLVYDSPCIDAGTNLASVLTDLDGNARPLDGNFDYLLHADMGAYEYDAPSQDLDGDGMPDGWEYRYGLDPSSPTNAVADDDEDGLPSTEEYVADTIPTDDLSALTMTALASSGGTLVLQWEGGVLARQFVECAAAGLGSSVVWQAVSTSEPPTSLTGLYMNSSPMESNVAYRVRAAR